MIDDIKNIDSPLSPLFKTKGVKKVREISKRPEEDRSGRDTYSESDELLLARELERLKKDKPAPHEKVLAAAVASKEGAPNEAKPKEGSQGEAELDSEGKDGKKKHINIIV